MKLGWQRGWGGNRNSLPYLVFVLTLASTMFAWVWARQVVITKDRERFTYASDEAEMAIKDRVGYEVELLLASAAAFKLQGGWTRAQFHSYVENLDLGSNYRGSQGVGYIQRTRLSEIGRLLKRLHAEGATDFAVHPAPSDREMYPLVYLEPQTDLNEQSIGYDGFTDPIRRAAMQLACDTGQPTMSGLVSVPSARSGHYQTGFLLFCPIYQGGKTPESVSERHKLLVGYVYSRFRGSEIFRDVLEGEVRHDLNIQIFDAEPGKVLQRFYRSSRVVVERHAAIQFDGYIPVLGRQWLVRYYSSAEFEQQSASWLVRFIPIGGVLLSTFLAIVSFSQVRAYRQLNGQAAALIRSEAAQRLLANVGARLVEAEADPRNFNSIGLLVISNISDWFAICLKGAEQSPPTVVTVWDVNAGADPSGALKDLPLLDCLLELDQPIRFELTHGPDPHFYLLQEFGLVGIAAVPLADRHGQIGVIVLGRVDKVFDKDDLDLLVQIGSRAAVAIDSDRLFAEKERELDERKKAEEQVRRVNENLEQIVEERTTELKATNKELEAFCYSVSHDLRAPLRSVDGFSKSLLEDYRDQLDDQAKDYIARVRNASHRMDELISALLNLSRITRLEIVRHPIDVSSLAMADIEDVLDGRDRDRFEVSVQPGMTADGDPKLVRVIFDNLIRNAIKFSEPSEKPKIEIGSKGNIYFVRDNGVGFNPEYADKLFVAFERLHSQREFPGSGIGLATVQRIVQRHGGSVWAESEVGKGAVFFFTLRPEVSN